MKKYRLEEGLFCFVLCCTVFLSARHASNCLHRGGNNNANIEIPVVAESELMDNLENADTALSSEIDSFEKEKALVADIKPTYTSEKKDIVLDGREAKLVTGEITGNFYSSACKAGVPYSVIKKIYILFSSRLNFKTALRSGDKFTIVYDTKNNDVLYGKIKNNIAYAYNWNGKTEFLMENGEAFSPSQDRYFGLPIPGAKVSSPFGMRKHPVFGVMKKHTGVDFVANHGTPIRCVGSGYVYAVGYDAGYGRYVIVNHAGGYQTKYAHLSKSNVVRGQRLAKNSIIGLVGSSGISTGPHLHFELAKNGTRINPLSKVKVQPSHKLCGARLSKFLAYKNSIDRTINPITKTI